MLSQQFAMKSNDREGSQSNGAEGFSTDKMSPGSKKSPGEITLLLEAMRAGDANAKSKLIPVVYDELRRLAASYMRKRRRDHTLQATALVHEAYFRLAEQHTPWQNKAHFFAVAATLMRRILMDYARKRAAEKRGGEQVKISLDEAAFLCDTDPSDLIDLDRALVKLAGADARAARVVELHYFGGLTVNETAEVLGIEPRTVDRDWAAAKAYLARALSGH